MRAFHRLSVAIALGAIVVAGCSDASVAPTSSAPVLSTTTTATTTITTPSETTTTTVPDATTSTSIAPVPLVPLDELDLELVLVADGFDAPVLLVADPDGGPDIVVEQPGRVVRADDGRDVLVDLSADVVFGGEQGLLGLAYHPEFATNRLAYVAYVGEGPTSIIEEFIVGDGGVFDTSTRKVVLSIDQPAPNHNGGMIAFGPDGYLFVGMGDGGGSNDRFDQAQRPETLLGAMLRIAVGLDGIERYAIPPDNPFVDGVDGAPEVWAIGLRNPWRFAFDGQDLWIADVGQGEVEEINLVAATEGGLNYGWPIMEGTRCFRSTPCTTEGLTMPITEYGHGEGCSVTGGVVYRGSAIPELDGHFFYSDYCSGFIRSYEPDVGGNDWTERVGRVPAVSAFGTGGDGEVYVVSRDGAILRLERQP
ncbi:MAG TPA: PQQ-dependent sugar dehydrogenase [Acidimicrobiia bacterium]|nr:PQQ-dependent sugar dehydrogenase [Acidimicrobiia bacterium]